MEGAQDSQELGASGIEQPLGEDALGEQIFAIRFWENTDRRRTR